MDQEFQPVSKLSGYLEKKGRKKMMSCYKRYWFVLEGRLLLYYKSKDEYEEAIAPCKGSIPLGAACNIKPCTANIGVFQIENKTTTVTLRAESREEQHRWMHAIMSALNQGNNGTKLCYFRHSIGQLPTDSKEVLDKTNVLGKTQRSASETESNNYLIEKLQKLGAQSYGIELKTTRLPNLTEHKNISFSHESLTLKAKEKRNSFYGQPHKQKVPRTNSLGSSESFPDNVYERINSTDSVFANSDESIQARKKGDSQMMENSYYCSSNPVPSPAEVIYSEPGENLSGNVSKNQSVVTENNYYSSSTQEELSENRNNNSLISKDCNENSIKKQVSTTSSNLSFEEAENQYCEADEFADKQKSSTPEYADITVYSQTKKDKLNKRKSRFSSFYKKNKKPKEKPEEKLSKSESFLQKIWTKKVMKKGKNNISISNENMLNRLEMNDNTAMQMLTAFQEILEAKKQEFEEKHLSSLCQAEEMIYQDLDAKGSELIPVDTDEKELHCPQLPPRNYKQKSLLQDQLKNSTSFSNKTREIPSIDDILNDLNLQKKVPQNEEPENDIEGEGKVRKLIKRFSMGKDDSVELRIKRNLDSKNGKRDTSSTDSGELNRLLDELAQVTTAPIMTPGVTTSLINPEMSDYEFLKLVPVRRRRLSDPDYDVPRPHRSLTNVQKKDADALQATRFFGPILKPSELEIDAKRPQTPPVDYATIPSITPDSLEVSNVKNFAHDELNNSYHSHDYLGISKGQKPSECLVENTLYDDPRLLYTKLETARRDSQSRSFHLHQNSEFIDSLEM